MPTSINGLESLADKDGRSSAEATERKRGKAKKKREEKETDYIEFTNMAATTDAKEDSDGVLNYEHKPSKAYGKRRNANASVPGKATKLTSSNTRAGDKYGARSTDSDEGVQGSDGEVAKKAAKPKSFLKDYSRYKDENNDDVHEPPKIVANFKPNLLANLPDIDVRGADITLLTNWSDLGLTDKMRKIIGEVCALKTPRVASYLAPLILDGYDVKASVRVAPEHYLIPLACKLIADEVRDEETYDEERKKVTPYAVVITANAVRCDDVYRIAREVLSKNHLKTRKSSGTEKTGKPFERSMQRLKEGCHVLCTTVMRAELLFNLHKMVSTEKVRYLVLDDMHKLYDENEDLLHDVLIDLVKGFPPNDNRQTLLLSASDISRLGYLAAASLKEDHSELYEVSDDK